MRGWTFFSANGAAKSTTATGGSDGSDHDVLDHADATVEAPSTGDAVIWDSATSKWIADDPTQGGDEGQDILRNYPRGYKVAKVHLGSAQSVATGTTRVKLVVNTETFDEIGVTVSAGDITVPEDGFYAVLASVAYATNNTGNRAVAIRKNATRVAENWLGAVAAGTEEHSVSCGVIVYLNASADTIDVVTYQTSGGALNAQSGEHKSWVALIKLDTRVGTVTARGSTSTATSAAKTGPAQMSAGGAATPPVNPSGVMPISNAAGGHPVGPQGLYLGSVSYEFSASGIFTVGIFEAATHTGTVNQDAVTAPQKGAGTVPADTGINCFGLYSRASAHPFGPGVDNRSGAARTIQNTQNQLGIAKLTAKQLVKMFHEASSESIATGTTLVKLATMNYHIGTGYPDDDFFHTAGNFDIPRAGKWLIIATATFTANATGRRSLALRKNGTTVLVQETWTPNTSLNSDSRQVFAVVDLLASDTIDMSVFQNSGGALTVLATLQATSLAFVYLGP